MTASWADGRVISTSSDVLWADGRAWGGGAFEYVDEGGTLSIPVAMHHYNLLRSA